jgi:hypothetical protein
MALARSKEGPRGGFFITGEAQMKALIVATTLLAVSPAVAGSIPSVPQPPSISGDSNANGVSAPSPGLHKLMQTTV